MLNESIATNRRRVRCAIHAVRAFHAMTDADPDTVLRDLLTDLMHLCVRRRDKQSWNFERELEAARRAYEDERVLDKR
jgi:hypothetical protein